MIQDLTKFYIDGRWQTPDSAETMQVVNPTTEEDCALISLGNQNDVDAAVGAATRAFESYGFSSKNERIPFPVNVR